jgi:teichuronic acid biosynthesis glycosyltransferase TuaH
LFGHRSYGELAAYLGAIDVGIVPYSDSRFNRASFPLKLLEYLAAGVAPVSTDLPAVRWLNTELVRVGRDHAEFLGAIEESLAEIGDEVCRSARVEFARHHSWSARATEILEILDRLDETQGRRADR